MNRYRIDEVIGQGTFAIVYKALDIKYNQLVCIKLIKNSGPKYIRLGLHEQQMCKEVIGLETSQQFITSFQYGNNICLVFELLGSSLYKLIVDNQFHGIPENISTQLIYYSLLSLKDLKNKKIIHADIKPHNILTLSQPVIVQFYHRTLVLPQVLTLKLCDFGSAFFEYDQKPQIVQTQAYRSPEVILGDQYSYPIDIFSLGCVYFELITGIKLFECKSQLCQILLMQKQIKIDTQYILDLYVKQSKTMETNELMQQFNRIENKFIYRKGQISDYDEQKLRQAKPVSQILYQYGARKEVVNLIEQMLQFNPNKRISAEQALEQSIFTNSAFCTQLSESISTNNYYNYNDVYEQTTGCQAII